jgi:hypothetical protein
LLKSTLGHILGYMPAELARTCRGYRGSLSCHLRLLSWQLLSDATRVSDTACHDGLSQHKLQCIGVLPCMCSGCGCARSHQNIWPDRLAGSEQQRCVDCPCHPPVPGLSGCHRCVLVLAYTRM